MSGEHRQSGEPVRLYADEINGWNLAFAAILGGRQRGPHAAGGGGGETILVRNDTEVNQERFAVLGINGPIFTPTENFAAFCNHIVFSGVAPTRPTHYGKFVISQIPLAVGAIGPAMLSGMTQVRIDVDEGKSGYFFATIVTEETGFLESSEHNIAGTMILWKEGGLGEQWAIVRMSNLPYPVYL